MKRKLFEQILLEANVANIKDPIGGKGTLLAYLKQYASGLGAPELQNAFIKKLTTILINDPRNLHALREVPDNAPDWAKQAAAQGQLMIFIPDAALNDTIQHIIHYLAAAEQDSKQVANNDQRVFAQRELAGFPKAENLTVLAKKSNEYFARGTRNVKRQAAGMEQVFDAGNGFIWYMLQTAEAYQREGKILQNCIGSHYTPEKCRREGTIIFVMRNSKDNTVVAARVKKESDQNQYRLEEVKGKQNKAPVNQYMQPTIKFLNKMHFNISSSAKNDLSRAGYFYEEGEFYDLPTAIKKFLDAKEIAPLPSGGGVFRITGNPEIMNRAYPNSSSATVYDIRSQSGEPEFAFYVVNFILVGIKNIEQSLKDNDEEEHNENNADITTSINPERRNEAYTALYEKDLISGVSQDIRKHFFWNEKLRYNTTTKKFNKVVPDKEHKRPPDQHAWDQYSSPELISEIHSIVNGDRRYDSVGLPSNPKDIKNVYLMHRSGNAKLVFLELKNKTVIPGVIENGVFRTDVRSFGFTAGQLSHGSRVEKEVRSVVSFANDNALHIPIEIRKAHGIVETPSGYEVYQPQPKIVMQNPTVILYSFEGLKGENKTIAVNYIADHVDLKKEGDDSTRRYGRPVFAPNGYGSKLSFNANDVSAFLKVNITYGVDKPHKFLLALDGKNIIDIDYESKNQKWQSWDDFDKITTTINKVKNDLGLTFSPNATSGSEEFKVINGELSTKSQDIKQRLEKKLKTGKSGKEGVDELPYDDGSKLVKLSPGEQAGWMRQSLGASNFKGDAWKLVKPDGTIPYVYFVHNGKILRIYKHYDNITPGKMPEDKAYNQEALKYLKGAAEKFGWQPDMPTLVISPQESDGMYRDLQRIEEKNIRGKLYGCSDIHKEPAMQRLIRFGLAKRVYKPDEEDEFTHTYWIQLTPQGEEALRKLRQGQKINGLNHIPAKEVDPDFELPTKQEQQPVAAAAQQPAREPRQAIAGQPTKAAIALEKFREMQQANGGRVPTVSEFKAVLTEPPFNMSPLAAQTYYYATKKRVAAPIGENVELDFGCLDLSLLRSISDDVKVMHI